MQVELDALGSDVGDLTGIGAAVVAFEAAPSATTLGDVAMRLGLVAVMSLATTFWALLFRRFVRERKASEYLAGQRRALQASEDRYRTLLQSSSDLVAVVEPDTTIRFLPASTRTLGLAPEDLLGTRLLDRIHPADAPAAVAFIEQAFARAAVAERVGWRLRHADGSWVPLDVIAADHSGDVNVSGLVLTMRDVAERNDLKARLERQALLDPLTGLPNRLLFSDRVAQALARRERQGAGVAVAFCDLDDFKSVNEGLGHHAGDEVLLAVAAPVPARARRGHRRPLRR